MSHHKHHSREEIAKIEIGHTDSTPAINWFLTLFFLAVITAVPLLQTGREFAAIRAGKESDRKLPQSFDVFSFLLPSRAELTAPASAESGLLAALLYLAGCFNFILAWRRWANGRGSLRAPQAFFATFIPYLAAGVVVGSPSGDTRVLLVLNIMLLAGFLIHSQKAPINAS